MSTIRETKAVETSIITGRKCDVCGSEEVSQRDAIKFDHGSDSKWARVQLCLTDYTNVNNNRVYDLCSYDCWVNFSRNTANLYKAEGDCLGGVPLSYIRGLLT